MLFLALVAREKPRVTGTWAALSFCACALQRQVTETGLGLIKIGAICLVCILHPHRVHLTRIVPVSDFSSFLIKIKGK